MKKYIILFLIFFLSSMCIYAQTKENIAKDDKFYQETKTMSVKLLSSKEYIENQKIIDDFLKKVPKDYFETGEDTSDFDKWIANKIDNSGFKSVEDAVTQYKTFNEVYDRHEARKKEMYDRWGKLSEKYGEEWFNEIFMQDIYKLMLDSTGKNEE